MSDVPDRQPTIAEMRLVARYMHEVMGLHSAAGKLLENAARFETIVEEPDEGEEGTMTDELRAIGVFQKAMRGLGHNVEFVCVSSGAGARLYMEGMRMAREAAMHIPALDGTMRALRRGDQGWLRYDGTLVVWPTGGLDLTPEAAEEIRRSLRESS